MIQFSLVPFGLVAGFAPFLFRVVFGPEWQVAGEYTRILIPWLFAVFLSSPFVFLPDLFKKQGTALLIDIVKLLLRAGALFVGVYFGDIFVTLILLSGVSLVVLIYQIVWYFNLAKEQSREIKTGIEKTDETYGQGPPWRGAPQEPDSFSGMG